MFAIIKELLENSETGDQALDQQVNDIRRKHQNNPAAAEREADKIKRERLNQVSARIKSLMVRKKQFNDQIDKQIEVERSREQQRVATN